MQVVLDRKDRGQGVDRQCDASHGCAGEQFPALLLCDLFVAVTHVQKIGIVGVASVGTKVITSMVEGRQSAPAEPVAGSEHLIADLVDDVVHAVETVPAGGWPDHQIRASSGLEQSIRGPAGGDGGVVSQAQLQQYLRVAGQVQAVLDQAPDRGSL